MIPTAGTRPWRNVIRLRTDDVALRTARYEPLFAVRARVDAWAMTRFFRRV